MRHNRGWAAYRKLEMEWDLFISHASEDKADVVRPLTALLSERGLRVWVDEQQLVVGDSLRRTIDRGLSHSACAVVILSRNFFAKKWPLLELDSLVSLEALDRMRILPVWHGLTHSEVAKHAPLLAARLGIETSMGLDVVCEALCKAVGHYDSARKYSTSESDAKVEEADILDGYQLNHELGRGGTGVVYDGLHLATMKRVAVKMFAPLPRELAEVGRATARSVRGLASIDSPNIVRIVDFGAVRNSHDVVLYLVTEIVNGMNLYDWTCQLEGSIDREDLFQRILSGESPPPAITAARLDVAIQIAEALAVVHNCQFVGDLGFMENGDFHGDLKPHNILIDRRNHPVIVDFMMPDIHRLLQPHLHHSLWSKGNDSKYSYHPPTTGIYGTPGFMAPEQELEGVVTPLTDIYSLGKTFIQLFWPCGNRDMSHRGAFFATRSKNEANRMIGNLVINMIEAQPSDRPQSMTEVCNSLRQIRISDLV